MNKEFLKKIFFKSLTGFLSLALAILLFFCIQRMDQLRYALRWLLGVLTPFVYGGAMAYLLKTPCGFLEGKIEEALPEKHKKRANVLSVVAVLLISALLIYLLLNMVIPEMVSSIVALAVAVPPKAQEFANWVVGHLEGNELLQNYVNNAFTNMEGWLRNWANTELLPTVQNMMGGAVTAVSSVFTVLKNIILGVIICIYLLVGRKKFAKHGTALVYALFKPERADAMLKEFAFIDRTFVGFFSGKILDSAIVGLICYAFCVVMTVVAGFQNAVLISVIIGVTNDKQFGPMLLVGMGGVFVEVFKDAALYPVPLNKWEARAMLEKLKSYKMLTGYRGSKPCDIEALTDMMVKIAGYAYEHRDEIKEMDLNPVFVYPEGEGVCAVDALIVKYTD